MTEHRHFPRQFEPSFSRAIEASRSEHRTFFYTYLAQLEIPNMALASLCGHVGTASSGQPSASLPIPFDAKRELIAAALYTLASMIRQTGTRPGFLFLP